MQNLNVCELRGKCLGKTKFLTIIRTSRMFFFVLKLQMSTAILRSNRRYLYINKSLKQHIMYICIKNNVNKNLQG